MKMSKEHTPEAGDIWTLPEPINNAPSGEYVLTIDGKHVYKNLLGFRFIEDHIGRVFWFSKEKLLEHFDNLQKTDKPLSIEEINEKYISTIHKREK